VKTHLDAFARPVWTSGGGGGGSSSVHFRARDFVTFF